MLRREDGETLAHYLAKKVFDGKTGTCMNPDTKDVEGFRKFIERYKKGIAIEQAALTYMVSDC